MKSKRKLNKKIIILTAVALITAVLGTWLFFAPNRERDYINAAQESLLDDLILDIQANQTLLHDVLCTGATAVFEAVELGYLDAVTPEVVCEGIYNGEMQLAVYEADGCIVDCEPATLIYKPIPDNDFPNAINGIGILTIKSIDLRLPIAEGVDEETLRIAPGRVPQTAQIGEIGNAVIAGHRNYTFGSMFNRFDELIIGDVVHYQARSGEMMAFVVFEIAVIEPHDQIAFLQPVNDSIITLYTCTPIQTAEYRLIIRAYRIY
ncbi:MAG: class D sortase [Defluviitaleaceae bacterium]|nr:class D sortase [Defluviitaleaceae bacterium]